MIRSKPEYLVKEMKAIIEAVPELDERVNIQHRGYGRRRLLEKRHVKELRVLELGLFFVILARSGAVFGIGGFGSPQRYILMKKRNNNQATIGLV